MATVSHHHIQECHIIIYRSVNVYDDVTLGICDVTLTSAYGVLHVSHHHVQECQCVWWCDTVCCCLVQYLTCSFDTVIGLFWHCNRSLFVLCLVQYLTCISITVQQNRKIDLLRSKRDLIRSKRDLSRSKRDLIRSKRDLFRLTYLQYLDIVPEHQWPPDGSRGGTVVRQPPRAKGCVKLLPECVSVSARYCVAGVWLMCG